MNVSTSKCEKNLLFIFKKLGEIETTLKALIEHLGLEMRVTNKDGNDGKTEA